MKFLVTGATGFIGQALIARLLTHSDYQIFAAVRKLVTIFPSKIFEYAALGRPIVAGLNGYSAQFLKEYIPYACLFDSGDSSGAESCFRNAVNSKIPESIVRQFVDKYSRDWIMDVMSDNLLVVASRCR